MSKRFVLHEDNNWDAKAIYIEDTKHDIDENSFLCEDAIVDELNNLYYQVCNLKGLVEQRNKQIKNLKTNNKHNIEKKNHRIAVLERALKKACKALIKDDGSMVMRFMDGQQIHNSNEAEHYFIDQAEKELKDGDIE